MTDLQDDRQIDEMLQDKEILRLAAVKTATEFTGFSVYQGVYSYLNHEDGELIGVRICSTPMKGNNMGEHYGGRAEVIRLFNRPNEFCVYYEETVPYLSNDEGESTYVGAFAKLNNAMIAALIAHEKGGRDIEDIEGDVLNRKKKIFLCKRDALKSMSNPDLTC